MASGPPTSPLRQILYRHLSQLSLEVESLLAEARHGGESESADQLNQAARRIRQAADPDEIGATLLDAAGAFSSGAAWFGIAVEAATGERIRGVPEDVAEAFQAMEIPLASAAALAGAVESRDPVVAAATPREVSEELVRLLHHPPDGRVSIFPLVVRDRVPALLYAWGDVQGSAVELLTQVAAAVWTAMSPPPAPAWDRLPLDEQRIHLRAQRFARGEAAQMRLFQSDAVLAGRAGRTLRCAPQFHRCRA